MQIVLNSFQHFDKKMCVHNMIISRKKKSMKLATIYFGEIGQIWCPM